MKRYFYIAFEGLDECGKTTQAQILSKKMGAKLIPALKSTIISQNVYNALNYDILPLTEVLLFLALRVETIHKNVIPMLQFQHVICDRDIYSTCAYQGSKGVSIDKIKLIENMINSPKPDLVFLFLHQYKKPTDKLSTINSQKVIELFLEQKKENWIIVPDKSIKEVASFIDKILCERSLL